MNWRLERTIELLYGDLFRRICTSILRSAENSYFFIHLKYKIKSDYGTGYSKAGALIEVNNYGIEYCIGDALKNIIQSVQTKDLARYSSTYK